MVSKIARILLAMLLVATFSLLPTQNAAQGLNAEGSDTDEVRSRAFVGYAL